MQRKILCVLFVCATLLLTAPALMAEEATTEKATADAIQVLETVQINQGEEVTLSHSERVQEQASDAADLGLPVAAVATAASVSFAGDTCVQCSTHADCASVCGGGQIYYDYRCQWTWPQVCGEHIKQCWCS